MSASHSVQAIQDTQLGLTQSELQIFRQQRQVLAQRGHQGGMADRGRDPNRHSQASSRAASAASSQAGNLILLDSRSLQALQVHLDNVLRAIGQRISELEDATERSVNTGSTGHRRTEASADEEIARMRRIMAQFDQLEEDFKKVTRIKEVVKRLRIRVDEMDEKVDKGGSCRHDNSRHDESRHGGRSSIRHGDDRHRDRHR